MNQGGWNGGAAQPGGGPQQGYGQAPQQPPQGQQGYPAPQQGYPPQQGPQVSLPSIPKSADAAGAAKGFGMGLIDFSFTTFIAPKVIKVVYVLLLVAVVLGMLGGAWDAFDYTFLRSDFHFEGLLRFLLLPLMGAGAVIVGRLYCELLVVMFKIAENLVEINRKTKE